MYIVYLILTYISTMPYTYLTPRIVHIFPVSSFSPSRFSSSAEIFNIQYVFLIFLDILNFGRWCSEITDFTTRSRRDAVRVCVVRNARSVESIFK